MRLITLDPPSWDAGTHIVLGKPSDLDRYPDVVRALWDLVESVRDGDTTEALIEAERVLGVS
jgi:hypothetical protein